MAEFRAPSARIGLEAVSRAATNPAKSPSVLPPCAARHPGEPQNQGDGRAAEDFEERIHAGAAARHAQKRAEQLMESQARAAYPPPPQAGRQRTVLACAKLSVSSDEVSPIRSCIPPDARRTFRPTRWIGTAASG